MEPAGRVARDIGVNYNTVLRYYGLLRKGISLESERQLRALSEVHEVKFHEVYFGRARNSNGEPDRTVPLFALSRQGDHADIYFAERLTDHVMANECYVYYLPDSWIFPETYPDCHDLECIHSGLNARRPIHSIMGNTFKVCDSDAFYPFVINHLTEYHGGFKKNFRLFVREAEFRYNHKKVRNIVSRLYELLKLGETALA